MMQEVYKELEEALSSIKNPFIDEEEEPAAADKSAPSGDVKADSAPGKAPFKGAGEDLENIDVSYDTKDANEQKQGEKIDISNDQVKDRWSRYIGAMGIEAVAKQAESRVLICELGALGVEVAKNIVLAGCKELVIFEKPSNDKVAPISTNIASGQFFLSEDDKEPSKALQCKHKLQQLNHYVKVTVVRDEKYLTVVDYLKEQKQQNKEAFKAVVMTGYFNNKQREVEGTSAFCREESIPFILTHVNACTAKILTDFGEKFKVLEQNSEEVPDVMIQAITSPEDEEGVATIKLIEGFKHPYQEGDQIEIREVQGMLLKGDEQSAQAEDKIDSSSAKP